MYTLGDEINAGFLKGWVNDNVRDLQWLAHHLEMPEEDVIIDMLSDVIDVWMDAHKGTPCSICIESENRIHPSMP